MVQTLRSWALAGYGRLDCQGASGWAAGFEGFGGRFFPFWVGMNILVELQNRFAAALAALGVAPGELVEMVRPSGDAKFGDYQANLAMPLGKQLGRPPRDVAAADGR